MVTEDMEREEAIRRIKAWNLDSDDMEVLAAAIPELAESEDERIRKALVEYFAPPVSFTAVRGISVQKVRDWLEKKEEQKSVECIDFDNEFENQVSHLLASVLNGEWEYNKGFVKHAAQSLLGYAKNEIKPDEWDKREKLFTKALQTANAQIGQLVEENYNYKLKEQKSEWSEEDKVYLEDALWCVRQAAKVAKDENDMGACWSAENWLKSFPERFNLQPKQKWSKEQIGALNYAYCELFKRGDVGHNILGPLQKLCDELRNSNHEEIH